MNKTYYFILAFILILQSCAVRQQKAYSRLSGTWTLESINGEHVASGAKTPYLEFRPDENRVFGSGGCNRLSGQIELAGDTVKFRPLISTKMACPGMETEQKFLDIISDNEMNFKVSGERLTLRDDANVLVFSKSE